MRADAGMPLWVDGAECRRFDSYVVKGPTSDDCDFFTGAIGKGGYCQLLSGVDIAGVCVWLTADSAETERPGGTVLCALASGAQVFCRAGHRPAAPARSRVSQVRFRGYLSGVWFERRGDPAAQVGAQLRAPVRAGSGGATIMDWMLRSRNSTSSSMAASS